MKLTLPTKPQTIKNTMIHIIQLYLEMAIKLLPISLLYAVLMLLPNVIYGPDLLNQLTQWQNFIFVFLLQFFALLLFLIMLHRSMQIFIHSGMSYVKSVVVATKKSLFCLLTGAMVLVVVIAGTLLLILPGVYLYILLLFCIPCILFDNASVFGAFKCSAKLTYNHWARTFFIILIVFAVAVMITVSGETLSSLSWHHYGPFDPVSNIISAIITAFIIPWFIAGVIVLYWDLKLRRV